MESMSSTPIRTAVLGFGFAGKIFHSPFISAVPGLELSAIVTNSNNPARSPQAAAAAYPSARILSTPEEAFADPNIDLIVVATPNDSHFELAALALQSGKHVVVDKPLSISAESALSLIADAKSAGRMLAPFHNRRFDTDTLTAKKLVTESTLGRVTSVAAHYDRFRPLVRPNTWKESGGIGGVNGLLYDLGPHLIDQALSLFGAPTHITASVRADRDVTDIDDAINISLRFEIGGKPIRYDIGASMLASDPAPRLRLNGTLGSYTKQGLDPQEAALLGGKRPPSLEATWLPEPETSWGTLTLGTRLTEPVELSRNPYPSVTGDYRLFYANVRDVIRGKAQLIVTAADGYRVIRLLELALQSSKEQRTLPVTFEV
jgi:scyllo-inositol 2-dehydrogenase (NADP+)